MITHASRRPSDRAGRRRRSAEFGLPGSPSRHRAGTLAGVPLALLLALSALFVAGVAVSGPAAGAATSAPAGTSTASAGLAWSQLGADGIAHVGVGRPGGQLCGERGPESLEQKQPERELVPRSLRD